MTHELEPGTSYRDKEWPRIVLPVTTGPEEVILQPEAGPRLEEVVNTAQKESGGEEVGRGAADDDVAARGSSEDRMEPVEADRSEKASWQEALAARYRDML